MTRFTTPTHTFKTPVDLTDAPAIYISYKQYKKIILEKDKDHIEVRPDALVVTLTQEETGRFVAGDNPVEIQVRARLDNGKSIVSGIFRASVNPVLKEGVI